MRSRESLFLLWSTFGAAFVFVVVIALAADSALGDDAFGHQTSKNTIDFSTLKPKQVAQGRRVKHRLTPYDQVVALASVQLALSQVGDGGRYLWRRGHGKLAGVIQPTSSFKDDNGRVCRHIVVLLLSGSARGRTEAVACRLNNGIWEIGG